ncbi:MAG: hypothetical protein ABIJ40_09530 [Bacteroidota bacterium]
MSKKQIEPKPIPNEIIQEIMLNYENQVTEQMGQLHNKFVGYISEAKIPIPNVITLLQMLLKEALDLANQKYLKE